MDSRITAFHHLMALASSATNPLGLTMPGPRTQYARCAAVQYFCGLVQVVVLPLVALTLWQQQQVTGQQRALGECACGLLL